MAKFNFYSKETKIKEADQKLINISETNDSISSHSVFQKRYNDFSSIVNKAIPLWFNNPQTTIPQQNFPIHDEYLKGCTAIKLSMFLIDRINNNPVCLLKNNHLDEEFYIHCLNSFGESNFLDINDADLLMIYINQLIIILQNSNIINNSRGIATIKEPIPTYNQLYLKLFSTFWNKVSWEEIFQSMPEVAKELKKNRNILIDLMMLQEDKFRIDIIANEFLQITDLGNMNDLYLISFLDFYFFTWLRHFGIINYENGTESDPVMIEFTEYGRRFFNYFYGL